RERRAIERQAANLAMHRVIHQGSDRKPESGTELLFHCSSSLEPTSPCYATHAVAKLDGDIMLPSRNASAPARCLDRGNVDLLHRHHRLERAFSFAATD